jgi:glycosyltransferase involved in cell wall biosynthesis
MTPSSVPSFSVILPTYNRVDVVESTLRHLACQDYPADRFEVIVVDNSSDGTPEMVESVARETDRDIRVIRDAPRLPAIKRNLGLRSARSDLVLFLNDDVWARADLLREHARIHLKHVGERVAVVGCVEQSSQMPRSAFLEAYRPFAYHEIVDRADAPVDWRYFWSMNLSLPRQEMLERNLVFHEDWAQIGHEDVELGYRWTRAGRRVIYNPKAWVEHYHPHTLDSACRLQESIGAGLRDLERLVPEPRLLERYGVFSWRNRPRSVIRGLVRRALFNAWTVPATQRWLGTRQRNNTLTRWMYWKVMLHHTERGYRGGRTRDTRPLRTLPPLHEASARS